ncbi:CHAT domain-containing protein [Arthrobacter sp. ISL-30]|uniref:CHAT domain-containing protein n=1 Tax=Arthrobacter sp. ISL-30 TaxID=2819109 RepID=UPI001BED08CA|nr:CHAT domain-containing protein [Arthrobacter sp. ISL-30]MBT2513074.1 CHAT domain-containing protein [Arthrobacter sp. ISL-30]
MEKLFVDDFERGVSAWDEFELTGEVALLVEAVGLLRRAVGAATADRVQERTGQLGLALGRLYDQTYDLGALRESVALLETRTGPFVPDECEYGYACALQKLAAETEDLEVLDRAIGRLRSLSLHLDTDQPLRARALSALSTALQDRYEYASDEEALVLAVERAREAVEITPPDSPRQGPHLSHLGLALRMTFESTGSIDALDEAISVSHAAVDAIEDEVPSKDIEMSMLALALRFRYEALGDLEALEDSFVWQRRAIDHLPVGHGRLAPHQSNLALALWTRAERTGDMATVDEAIQVAKKAVASTSLESSDRQLYANNLGLALMTAARVRTESNELDEAIRIFEGIISSTTTDRALVHEAASNLAVALRQRGRDTQDLREALVAAEAADQAAPEGHVARVRYRTLAGILHRETAAHEPDPGAGLAASVTALRNAVAAAGMENPDRATAQFELATSLLAGPDTPAVQAEALRLVTEASAMATAAPRTTIDAARTAARLLAQEGRLEEAVEFYEQAIHGLSRVAPQTADLVDRGNQLESFLGIASEAASAAVELGDPVRALRLLERGRTLLFGALLDDVSLFAELKLKHPELADEFQGLRRLIDIGGVDTLSVPDVEDRQRHRRKWDDVIARIRAHEGFEDFLVPIVEVEKVPGEDPVVVLLVGPERCDALVLIRGTVTPVRLAGIDPDEVRARAHSLRDCMDDVADATSAGRTAAERRFTDLFTQTSAWIRDEIIGPVLPHIPGETRITWVPTGPFSGIPLHAAGDGRAGEGFVSNYAATLASLSHPDWNSARTSVAVIGGEDLSLQGADREAVHVAERLGAEARLSSVEATAEAVLAKFRCNSVVHVAVHGFTNPRKRFEGGLALADRDAHTIEVARAGAGLKLAYLSACDTASADDQLSDEPLHLAAALRAAGCARVVAALWPLDDRAGALLAEEFYAEGVVPSDTAAALHRAQQRLRDLHPDRPSTWAALTHWGPVR